jgi:hypothetical protein
MRNVLEVACHPDQTPHQQNNGNWRTTGVRDEITIVAVVTPEGSVWAAYPEAGPGVARNPAKEDRP